MNSPVQHDVTPELLAPMVEQPEPSVDGDWYVLDRRPPPQRRHSDQERR